MLTKLVAVVALLLVPLTAQAATLASDKVTKKIYRISGTTLPQLERAMQRDGPNGFWAYTRTNWNWDGSCNMKFRATIIMPELRDRGALSARDLRIWDAMIAALWAHEMEHVVIGRQWATAIKQADCVPAKIRQIDKKWRGADAELDKRTEHGLRTGVSLRP